MSKIKITKGKFEGIQACADPKGVIAAAAMDQRGSLKKSIGKAMGRDASDADLSEFKVSVQPRIEERTAVYLDVQESEAER